jgi:PAS domain S-box-containing protein
MTTTLQLLMVEDNPADVDLVREWLPTEGPVRFELSSVARLAEALIHVRDKRVDLVLLDLGLPDSQGLGTFQKMKAQAPDVPMVVCTGTDDREMAALAVRAGAQDYLVKGQAQGNLLVQALLYAVERNRAARDVVRAQKEWERTFDAVPDLITLVDANHVILRANRSMAARLGTTPEALVGRRCYEAVHGSASPPASCPHVKTLASGKSERHELVEPRLGGTFDVTTVPLKDEAGALVGSVHVFADISARKRAEAALQASEKWHRILFEKAHDALLVLSPPGYRLAAGNPAAAELFGVRDGSDFAAQPAWRYWPERQPDGRASAEKAMDMVERAMRKGSHAFQWNYQRASGQEFPASVLLTRMEIDGQPFLQANVRDETEKLVMQARLVQADRLSSMGLLAAGVAHEINNPLSFVLFNVESLAEDLPKLMAAAGRCYAALRGQVGDEAAAEAAGDGAWMLVPAMAKDVAARTNDALVGVLRIKEIARGLGTFSRVEQNGRSLVEVRSAIECAVGMARNEIKYRATLVTDFGQVPAVLASEGKLSQVFLNLLINASHAVGDGHPADNRIGIHTWSEGEAVFAEVSDNGHGIPPENLKRIFEPFYTTKPVGAGSGLGLAICKNILAEFGGDIGVTSEVGKGSRFVVRLPVPRAKAAAPPEEAHPETSGLPKVRGRLLIVDDEGAIRTMLQRMLGGDHEVVAAASGEEGRAILEADGSFDVILCDLMMPDMSGMELHEWLVARDPAMADRMVFLTGGAFTPGASEYLARVGNPRIEKPVDKTGLLSVVMERVRESRR